LTTTWRWLRRLGFHYTWETRCCVPQERVLH
jgi:hypothetical protein